MNPWFNPNAYGWLFGTLLGVLGGIYGTLAGALVPRGKCRRLVFGLLVSFIIYSIGLLIAGAAAWIAGQPYGVWYALALPGAIGTLVFSLQLPMLRRGYAQTEMRKMKAQDL